MIARWIGASSHRFPFYGTKSPGRIGRIFGFSVPPRRCVSAHSRLISYARRDRYRPPVGLDIANTEGILPGAPGPVSAT